MKEYCKLQKIVGNILDSPGMGGNVSLKYEDKILVKSSGEDLKNKNHNICIMKNDKLINSGFFNDTFIETKNHKPTMEYEMHKNIKSKYIIHYHPIYALPFICSDNKIIQSSGFNFYDYVNPGKSLGNIAIDFDKITILKNHGLVIHSNDLDELFVLYQKVKTFFMKLSINKKNYTPDDFIDNISDHLWLFRHAMENIAKNNNIVLNEISSVDQNILSNDINEKYRQQKVQK